MASAFSAPDASIISHTPSLDPSLLASTSKALGRSISDLYDVPFTIQRILQGGFKRVALQFSDEGLGDSIPIYWELKNGLEAATSQGQTPADLFLLADTSYGNCCVDEVAAAHVEADVVVHYGHACLSPTARLPVIYVFPKKVMKPVEGSRRGGIGAELARGAREALDGWEGQERKAILLTYDVGYAYAAEQVYQEMTQELQNGTTAAEASGSTPKKLPPLILATLDTARNFEDRIARPIPPRQEGEPRTNGCCRPDGVCSTNGSRQNGDACSSSPANGVQTNGSSCCSGGSSLPPLPSTSTSDPERLAGGDGSGRLYHLPPDTTLSDCLILYLGSESLALTNLLLRAGPTTPVLSHDPSNSDRGCRREDGRTNRLLMRRYAAVQKARDAEVVGLLVGTLGVQSYLPLLAHLRQLLTGRRPGESKTTLSSRSRKNAGRKVYTISVGKLNPAKLANFQEVDVFVLLACPENSLVDAVDPTGLRSKEFYKPIVTPFEMMLALDEEGRGWTGEYVLEMERLLATQEQEEQDVAVAARDGSLPLVASVARDAGEPEQRSDDDDQPHFSLVTGKYVSRRKFRHNNSNDDDDDDSASDDQSTERSGVISLRDSTSSNGKMTRILDSANARHLATRSWKGLEQRLGLDEPSVLEEGRQGIAKGYAEADGTKEG
jgi:diphthamide biosynthesis protein 2